MLARLPEAGPYLRTPPTDPAPAAVSCLAMLGILVAAAVLGLIIGFTLRLIVHWGFRLWSHALPGEAAWVTFITGLIAGAASLAYLLFINTGLGEIVGRFMLTGCCGLLVLGVVIGIINRLWPR